MDRPYSHILDRLKMAGLRPTRQRLALAKLLFDDGERHVTAEQLHSEALAHGVRVSLATVYNALHQFTAADFLREIIVDAGRSYFDTNTTDHNHFFFEDTRELMDIAKDAVRFANLPKPPKGTDVKCVDVIIRVENSRKS